MVSASSAARLAHFLYWLGPWAPRARGPRRVVRREVSFGARGEGSRLYLPQDSAIGGAWLISPGLHIEGARDPRMDRLARIMAAAGYVVLLPAIPDLNDLRLRPSVVEDLCRAFDLLAERPETPGESPVGILSVSIGSMAALRLASSPAYATRISRLVCVGGYASAQGLLRALLGHEGGGGSERRWDPLNQPVVFLTVLEHLGVPIRDAEALSGAWKRYMHLTWPRVELKSPDSTAHIPLARELATALCPEDRELFLIGCGALPGGQSLAQSAVDRAGDYYDFLDATSQAGLVKAPVHLVHGVHDQVIPFSNLAALEAAIPGARAYPLRFFAHGSPAVARSTLATLPGVARDAGSLFRIARALI
jgi:pimeloyl-ACP methyl ester carboxylesterase